MAKYAFCSDGGEGGGWREGGESVKLYKGAFF